MTKKEAFEKLKQTVGIYLMSGNADNTYCKEWREILETLKEEPETESCEDCVSRVEVLEQINCWIGSGEYRYTNATWYLDKRIKDLPSVQPKPNADTLDKIRGEIEGLKICVALDEEGEFWYRDALNDAIEIINKYIDRGMRGVI